MLQLETQLETQSISRKINLINQFAKLYLLFDLDISQHNQKLSSQTKSLFDLDLWPWPEIQ